MKNFYRKHLRPIFRRFGVDLVGYGNPYGSELDQQNLDEWSREVFDYVKAFSATGLHRVDALIGAIRYIQAHGIPGALVECGVWKGGSVMAMIRTLQRLDASDRDIYLFDTFSGMSTLPGYSDADVSFRNERAEDLFARPGTEKQAEYWSVPLPEVRNNLLATGYDETRLHFVEGRVEETVPDRAPGEIAFLRLDTDFYESTRHEMIHLYPRLAAGGVLLVDDYGHWQGARKAVDEYFAENPEASILLNRIDYSGRIGVKQR